MKQRTSVILALVLPIAGSAIVRSAQPEVLSDDICVDVLGCSGGELKCAEYRFHTGTHYEQGTCYDDLQQPT